MENRNQYNSPRDRIDDALLIRLLNEEEPMPEYTCTGERRNGRSSCQNGMQNRSAVRRSGSSCGCGETQERQIRCGEANERRNCSVCGESRERREGGCESCARGGCIDGYPLAMVYAPDHGWEDIFGEEEALEHGTMFRRLELPFYPGKCGCK